MPSVLEKNLSLPAAPFLQIFILPFYMNMSQNYIRNFKFQTTQTHNKEHVTKQNLTHLNKNMVKDKQKSLLKSGYGFPIPNEKETQIQ